MSIVTRTGDSGTTSLMYGRRVPKYHVRVETCGVVDELNAALGLARASADKGFHADAILAIQRDLVAIMGELATVAEDQDRYLKDGHAKLEPVMIAQLDKWVAEIEGQNVSLKGWATPGATFHSATLDVARTVCRRAERRITELRDASELPNEGVSTYFNRLSDLLWLMARRAETRAGDHGAPATS